MRAMNAFLFQQLEESEAAVSDNQNQRSVSGEGEKVLSRDKAYCLKRTYWLHCSFMTVDFRKYYTHK